MRRYAGPAILSYGFRPFFLLGAVWAGLLVAIWLPMLAGSFDLPTALAPIEWHVHELVYGYVSAIVAGFLLTAVPNWTGRLPVAGTPLLQLVLLWTSGRIAVLFSSHIGIAIAAIVDLLFLASLSVIIAREILAGRKPGNLKVLVVVNLLLVGNAVFHWEAMSVQGSSSYGMRIGIGATILLIILIGGRIVPSFTRNWLARAHPGRLPTPVNRFDAITIAAGAVAIACWVVLPQAAPTAALATAAGLLHTVLLGRWAGYRTAAEPLVLVLHVAYAFVPVGFLLLALAIAAPELLGASGALHAWTVGAIGTMTLAVMTRASLGHTGQSLVASPTTQLIYVSIIIAAAARIVAAFDIWREGLLTVSAVAWVAAFSGFTLSFGPLLIKRRTDS
jgi:uncharacterized protein involved in response to NO